MVLVEKHGFGKPEEVRVGLGWEDKSPWDYIQERDKELLGDIILDKKEQARWCRALFMAGGLPYIWDRCEDFKKLMYDALRLKKGDKVLIVGEAIEACGFLQEVKKILKGEGEIHAFEIIDTGRGVRKPESGVGSEEEWPTHHMWRYDYANIFPEEYFDAIFLPQGVHHETNWAERAKDFVRVLKRGKRIVCAEATLGLGPDFFAAVHSDVHIEAIFKKLFVGIGKEPTKVWEFTQPSPSDLIDWFKDYLEEMHSFVWKGMTLFYGTKK